MPSIQITISAWWAVAIVAQLVWLFGVVRPTFSWLRERKRRRLRDWQELRRWQARWEPVAMFIGGPLVWVASGLDEIDQWKRNRRKRTLAGKEQR